MNKTDFENFLKENLIKNEQEEIVDWEKQKEEWLDYVSFFYSQIEAWLEDYKSKGLVNYSYSSKNMTEDDIGSYSVNKMDLILGGHVLTFDPIGTMLIGTKGRIDLNGPKGTIRFILADKLSKGLTFRFSNKPIEKTDIPKPDWTWKIVERDASRITYIEFTEDNFLQALMELING